MTRIVDIAWITLISFGLSACGGGGGGTASPTALSITTNSLPNGVLGSVYSQALTATGGTAPYTWSVQSGELPGGLALDPVGGVLSGMPGALGTHTFTIQVRDASSPVQTDTQALNLVIGGSGAQYDPTWSTIPPVTTLIHAYDSAKTPAQNGSALIAKMQALTPGQRLEIQAGNFAISSYVDLTCTGTAANPVWIVGSAGTIITQTNPGQNILNIGTASPVRYLCIRGIEFTGGSLGLRFYDCENVWLDLCHIHHTPEAGLSTNSVNTRFMHFTRNEINDTGGTGEGMYLGANNGAVIMSESIVALNHIHHTNGATVSQGDGIELKQGSWGNLIAENLVHDCNYPCILVYGTAGLPQNIVERNVCYNSNDNTMQIQGECIVRNNLIMSGTSAAFASTDHQGSTTNLQVVHNTILNAGRAMNLSSWSNRAGMVLANNVVYSQSAESLRFPNGAAAVTLAGNVVAGSVSGVSTGFVPTANTTNPLADFTAVTWNATSRNALPVLGATPIGAANATHAVPLDITGAARVGGLDSGCYDRP